MITNMRPGSTMERSFRLVLKEYSMLAALLVLPERFRARAFFELRGGRSRLTEHTSYRNMGYWKDDPSSLDKACEAMVDLLGEAAGLGSEHTVLDVGCGFGEQDQRLMERFAPKKIVGIDLVPGQIEAGRRRLTQAGLAGRIDLRVGSATDLPAGDATFDRVLALECALHFVTREDFFREAHRVLRPGGKLALVDPVAAVGGDGSGVSGYLERALGAIPKANLHSVDVYADKLRRCGFVDVQLRSLRDDVYPGFGSYLARRLADPEVAGRMNAAVRMMWVQWVRAFQSTDPNWVAFADSQDYVLVVATVPPS